jgi:hypothetical protein
VIADPKPHESIRTFNRERAVVEPHSHGSKSANVLEVEGRMLGIGL